MLEVIPYLLIWIPVRGITGKMKYVQPGLTVHKRARLLGGVGFRVIHDHHNVSAFVVLENLLQKMDNLDPVVRATAEQAAARL